MKKLTKISILTLLTLFIYNCGENLIEEVKERYGGGELKVVEYYKKIGDTLKLECQVDGLPPPTIVWYKVRITERT